MAAWTVGIWLLVGGAASAQHELVTHHALTAPATECRGGLSAFLARPTDELHWQLDARSADAPCTNSQGWTPWCPADVNPGLATQTRDADGPIAASRSAAQAGTMFDVLPLLWWDADRCAGRTARFVPLDDGADATSTESGARIDLSVEERRAVRDVPAHLPSAHANDEPSTLANWFGGPEPESIPAEWGPDVIGIAGSGYQITMSAGRRGVGAPQGTMFLWRVDPTVSRDGFAARDARQNPSAGVVLTRPPGDYSLDWVCVAVSGAIHRR